MIRACGADDVALALPRRKFRKRRFQMIDDILRERAGELKLKVVSFSDFAMSLTTAGLLRYEQPDISDKSRLRY